jgi:hypothetical protein
MELKNEVHGDLRQVDQIAAVVPRDKRVGGDRTEGIGHQLLLLSIRLKLESRSQL